MQRRDRLEIIKDLLESLEKNKGALKQTRLMYKANLSHLQMKGYLEGIEKKGYIKIIKNENNLIVNITSEGLKFLQKIREMNLFEESLGF